MENLQREGQVYHAPDVAYQWPTRSLAELGINEIRLEQTCKFAELNASDSFLVFRDGHLTCERYWTGKSQSSLQQTFSGTKSVFALLVGRLIEKGVLAGLEQPICELVEELPPHLHQLTFENVMAMQSGVVNSPEIEQLGQTGMTQLEIALTCEIEADPFKKYYYNNALYRLLFTALERASNKSLEALTTEEVFEPLGFDRAYWIKLYASDGDNEVFRGYQSICMTPRDFAKSAQIIIDEGRWCDETYLASSYTKKLITVPGPEINPSFGLFHHLNAGHHYRNITVPDRLDRKLVPGAPDDTFLMFGGGGQVTVGIPSLGLVIVRTGTGVSLYEPDNPVAVLVRLVVDAVAKTG